MKKKSSHHSRVTDRECLEPVFPNLPVVRQRRLFVAFAFLDVGAVSAA